MRYIIFVLACFVANFSHAVDIQQVTSPKLGIQAWLVESPSLPMVNVHVSFKAGSVFDGDNKQGLAALTASLIPEGSGNMDAAEFTQKVESIGALFSASANRLSTTVAMRMLSDHQDASFKLLGQAITKPRFDEAAFNRIKDATLTGIRAGQQNPGHVAGLLLKEHLYENHPYGQPAVGTLHTVQGLTRFDVKRFYDQNYTQKNMLVSVVGDITAKELGMYLDSMFEGLKQGQAQNSFPDQTPSVTPVVVKKEMNVPQSTVYLAHKGITRDDPDYYAAYVMNYILGGGGFNSRLMEEVREKRGLAYGVYSYFEPLPGGGAFIASVSTNNKDVQKSIDLIKAEISRMHQGVSEKEFNGALSYLKGSFPLRLDSSSKVLGYLDTMQLQSLGMDYLDMWTKRIESVTQEDVKRVAKRLLQPNNLMTVIVGGGMQ